MKSDTIKAIFTNLLFVIGIILLIFGFMNGTLTAARLLSFAEYPLDPYQETRCEMSYPLQPMIGPNGETQPLDVNQIAAERDRCQASLARERSVKKTEDIVSSFTAFVAGAILVLSFRRFLFR